jgi:phage shock protein C
MCAWGIDSEGASAMEEPGNALEPRKLYRSETQRMVAGVCGGLAEYFNLDVTVVRVLFLILSVFGGSGIVIYLVMWIIVPDARKARN